MDGAITGGLWQTPIVRIKSSDPNRKNFGTGFLLASTTEVAYIVTCAHVVRDVGGASTIRVSLASSDQARSGNREATAMLVASGLAYGIDLAVLRVEGWQNMPRLSVCVVSAEVGTTFRTAGFRQSSRDIFELVALEGVLDRQMRVGSLHVANAWDIKLSTNEQLMPGHSGSPLIDADGRVLGVIVAIQGDGRGGTAIAIDALQTIWPGIPGEIGRYQTISEYFRRGTALTYRGRDPSTQQIVAIRVLPIPLLTPNDKEQFGDVATRLMSLNHRHILPVLSFNLVRDQVFPYLIQPYIRSGSLGDLIERGQQFPFDTALEYIQQAAQALSYAHESGLIHGNVKPSNLLLDGNEIRLSDFAFLQSVTFTPTRHSSYQAPEQIDGLPATAASDQYALAETACWLFSGQHAAAGGLAQLRRIRPQIASVLAHALELDPAQRYPSMIFFMRTLEHAGLSSEGGQTSVPLDQGQTQATQSDQPHPSPQPQRSWQQRLSVVALITACLLVVGGSLIYIFVEPFPWQKPVVTIPVPHTMLCLFTNLPTNSDDPGIPVLNGIQLAFQEAQKYNPTQQTIALTPNYQLTEFDQNDLSNVIGGQPNSVTGEANLQALLSGQDSACPNPIAVIGPYYSQIAESEIPMAVHADILMVGTTTTAPCLTEDSCDQAVIHQLGQPRTFVRLPDTDIGQGQQVATILLSTLNAQKIEVVGDGEVYGDQLAKAAITRLLVNNPQEKIWLDCLPGQDQENCMQSVPGVTVTSVASVEVLATDILQRTIQPDAVFFGGLVSNGAGQLRRLLGKQFPYVVPSDAANQGPLFFQSVGADASNIYATFPEPDPATFSNAGGAAATFFHNYQQANSGHSPGRYSANGYDAAEVIITALGSLLQPGMSLATIKSSLIARVLSGKRFPSVTSTDKSTNYMRFGSNGDNTALPVYSFYKSVQTPNSNTGSWSYCSDDTFQSCTS